MLDDVIKLRDKFAKTSNKLLRIIYERKYRKEMIKYGADIPLNIKIPESTVFPHGFYGIFISGWARIGENCTIFQQVTIGSNTLSDTLMPGAPTIGDNVYIGAGAKIIGGVMIGNNVRIGANCFVFKDVPDNTTVVMGQPRYISKENINNKFVSIDMLEKNGD